MSLLLVFATAIVAAFLAYRARRDLWIALAAGFAVFAVILVGTLLGNAALASIVGYDRDASTMGAFYVGVVLFWLWIGLAYVRSQRP